MVDQFDEEIDDDFAECFKYFHDSGFPLILEIARLAVELQGSIPLVSGRETSSLVGRRLPEVIQVATCFSWLVRGNGGSLTRNASARFRLSSHDLVEV